METDYFLGNDQISDCPSFNSIRHVCSQQRKISIGITLDSSAKRRSGILDKDNLGLAASTDAKSKKKDVAGGETVTTKRKETAPSEQEGSPWLTKKSVHQLSPAPEASVYAEVAGTKQKSGLCNKHNGLKDISTANEVQFFPIQTSISERNDATQKRFDDIGHNSNGEKNDKSERIDKSNSATEQVFGTERQPMGDKNENKVKAQSEALRMKLWELLGTVSSPNREKPISQPVDPGGTAVESKQKIKHTSGLTGKIRQNSDTIENDSENPSCENRRPVTRALTRNKASTRVQRQKPVHVASRSKQKCGQKNIFSFEEGLSGRGHGASSASTKKKILGVKNSGLVPQKITFQSNKSEDKTRQVAGRTEKSVSAERSSSHGSKMGGLHTLSSLINQNKIEQETIAVQKEFIDQPGTGKVDQKKHEEISTPAWPEKNDPPDDIGTSSFKKFLDQYDSGSPTFKPMTPVTCSSPEMEQRDGDHESADGIHNKGGVSSFHFSFRNLGSRNLHGANSFQSEPFDRPRDLQDSPLISPDFHMKENDGKESPLLSVSDGRNSENYGKDPRKESTLSHKTGTCEKPRFMLRRTKRFYSYGGNQSNECTPSPSSPRGTGESDWVQEQDEQNAEDGMTRAIGLLGLALEKLKGKVKSATRNKSSEVLKSAAERIQIQFRSVESQIQNDMGKLRSLSRQKRKRLESDFEEKENKLRVIHERFMKEISQHLQDCKGIVEGLEENQIELRDIAKEKNASYQKLISQAEETAQNQLHDTENRIAAIHELARKQMLQVKLAIAECLQGGI